MVVDDLEAIVRGLPPRRMQAAEPELATRYVRTTRGPCSARRSDAVGAGRRRLAVLRGERHRALRQAVAAALSRPSGTGTRRSSRSGSPRVDPERAQTEVRSLARGAVGRRDGAAHRLPSAARRLLAGPGALGLEATATERPSRRRAGMTQPPVLATAVKSLHEAAPDTAFLEEVRADARGVARLVPSRARAIGRRPRGRPPCVGVGRQRATLRPRARANRHRRDRRRSSGPTRRRSRRTSGRPISTTGATSPSSMAPRARLPSAAAVAAPFAYLDLPLNSILAVAEDDLAVPPGRDRRRRLRAHAAAAARLRDALDGDVGRRGGRVPGARPARRGRRHGHDRRSVSALRRRSRRRARAAARRRAPRRRPTASARRRGALGGDDGLEVERRRSTRATTGEARSGSTSTGSSSAVSSGTGSTPRPSASGGSRSTSSRARASVEYYEPTTGRAAREPRVLLERLPDARPPARSTVSYDPEPRTRSSSGEVERGLRAARGGRCSRRRRGHRGRRRRPLAWDGRPLVAPLRTRSAAAPRPSTCGATALPWEEVERRTSDPELAGDPVFARLCGRSTSATSFDELPSTRAPAGRHARLSGRARARPARPALVRRPAEAPSASPRCSAAQAGEPRPAAGRGRARSSGSSSSTGRSSTGTSRRSRTGHRSSRRRQRPDAAPLARRRQRCARRSHGSRRSAVPHASDVPPRPLGRSVASTTLGIETDAPNLAWSYELITPESGILLGDGPTDGGRVRAAHGRAGRARPRGRGRGALRRVVPDPLRLPRHARGRPPLAPVPSRRARTRARRSASTYTQDETYYVMDDDARARPSSSACGRTPTSTRSALTPSAPSRGRRARRRIATSRRTRRAASPLPDPGRDAACERRRQRRARDQRDAVPLHAPLLRLAAARPRRTAPAGSRRPRVREPRPQRTGHARRRADSRAPIVACGRARVEGARARQPSGALLRRAPPRLRRRGRRRHRRAASTSSTSSTARRSRSRPRAETSTRCRTPRRSSSRAAVGRVPAAPHPRRADCKVVKAFVP